MKTSVVTGGNNSSLEESFGSYNAAPMEAQASISKDDEIRLLKLRLSIEKAQTEMREIVMVAASVAGLDISQPIDFNTTTGKITGMPAEEAQHAEDTL